MKSCHMTKEEIIERYFKKPNLFGNRYCIFAENIRINKKGILQEGYYLYSACPNSWLKITWKEFNDYVIEHKNNKKEKLKGKEQLLFDNDINNFNWS